MYRWGPSTTSGLIRAFRSEKLGGMIASLPMYDFPEIREHTDALWRAISNQARRLGVTDLPDELTRPLVALDEHWLDPTLAFSQSCGYPVLRVLTDAQHILGVFQFGVGSTARPGYYRSAIVCRVDDTRGDDGLTPAFDGATIVANDNGSLSGWISFGNALAVAGVRVGMVRFSGAHVLSCPMVASGEADLACIDGHTLSLLSAHRPAALEGIRVIGHGPEIPATPLFTTHLDAVLPLRVAVTRALTALPAATLEALQIMGFVPWSRDVYEPVAALASTALAVLPT